MNKKYQYAILIVLGVMAVGCQKNESSPAATNPSEEKSKAAQPEKVVPAKVAPEDDDALQGTRVLGFKLQQSTFDSVKARLRNYKSGGESYAGGPILENDGSGFDLENLQFSQFGFDKNNKLVYVYMLLHESNHMSKETYHKVVGYVAQNGYKVVRKKEPFVGDQLTEFETPNKEIITVSAPHLGGFKVHVEYLTHEFSQQRSEAQQASKNSQTQAESANF